MSIILYGIIAILIMIYQSCRDNAKTDAMDNNPNCTIKTDKWKKAHGLL